jgi:hypothetical protein
MANSRGAGRAHSKAPQSLEPGANVAYPMQVGSVLDDLDERGYSVDDITPIANRGHGLLTGKFDESRRELLSR